MLIRNVAWMLMACSLAGCTYDATQERHEELSETEDALFVHSKLTWQSPSIAVCWLNSNDAQAKAWTRDAVESTWAAVSRVQFTGWGSCSSSAQDGIRIEVNAGNPKSYIGTDAKLVSGASMFLNFDFTTWSPVCQSQREHCIRALAVHEFGHALGFAHEQARPDTPNWCDDQPGTNADTIIGPWDEHSVMNYCNAEWNNGGQLSATDVQGVQTVYGVDSGPVVPKSPTACGRLLGGEGLVRGDTLSSCDGRFGLAMQHDGNLVLYHAGKALWHTVTHGTSAATAVMQGDGNLVLYSNNATPIWASGTHGHNGAVFYAQDDGNLVIYDAQGAIWHTGTYGY